MTTQEPQFRLAVLVSVLRWLAGKHGQVLDFGERFIWQQLTRRSLIWNSPFLIYFGPQVAPVTRGYSKFCLSAYTRRCNSSCACSNRNSPLGEGTGTETVLESWQTRICVFSSLFLNSIHHTGLMDQTPWTQMTVMGNRVAKNKFSRRWLTCR